MKSNEIKTIGIELQPCLGQRSGVGTYEYELVKRLTHNNGMRFVGHVFNFLGKHDNSLQLKDIELDTEEQKLIPYKVYRLFENFLSFPYDWCFKKNDLNLFVNYVVPRKIKGKVITTVHDVTYLRFPETVKKITRIRLQSGLKRSINRADRIITISEFSKREIVECLGVPAEKIEVVYCAAPKIGVEADFQETGLKYGIDKAYILYVGTIEPRKNLVNLIKSYELLRTKHNLDYKLVLAGGKGWNNDDIYNAASDSCYSDDILFTGFISDEEKWCLLRNASIFVFPSIYEGFGIPPLEAMECGVPVLVSSAASLPEVVGDAGLIADPYSIDEISEGMYKLLTDKNLRENFRSKGFKRVEHFSWDISAKKVMQICEDLLNS